MIQGVYLLEGGQDVLVSIRVFDSADEALPQTRSRQTG